MLLKQLLLIVELSGFIYLARVFGLFLLLLLFLCVTGEGLGEGGY